MDLRKIEKQVNIVKSALGDIESFYIDDDNNARIITRIGSCIILLNELREELEEDFYRRSK